MGACSSKESSRPSSSTVNVRQNNDQTTNGAPGETFQSHASNSSSAVVTSSPAPAQQSQAAHHHKTPSNPSSNSAARSPADKYEVLKVLGEGASCKVVSIRDKDTKQKFAMKIMKKSESYNKVLFDNETTILQRLRHPNILEFVESFEDRHTYNLVTVLCQGGELFDRVKDGSFSEKVASSLTRQMLNALSYAHSHNIVHRDLKPENFVFETNSQDSTMKLIDFGCAKIAKDDEIIQDVAGSPYYAAVEVLNEHMVRTGAVWKASDMWSCGVIIFLLVTGYPPFNGSSQDSIFRKIKKGKYRFPTAEEMQGVQLSESVKELITKLLQMQPSKRLSAAEALQHPWVTGETASDVPLPPMVINALTQFASKCRLKKAVGRVLSNRMTEDDKQNLASVFRQFDKNGDGQLGAEEIAALMKHIGQDGTTAQDMLETMDDDGDGGVSLQEFQSAAAVGRMQSEKDLRAAFDMFDLDKDGFITHKEIEKVCAFLTPDAIKSLISEVDKNSDGKINLDEWIKAMQGDELKGSIKQTATKS